MIGEEEAAEFRVRAGLDRMDRLSILLAARDRLTERVDGPPRVLDYLLVVALTGVLEEAAAAEIRHAPATGEALLGLARALLAVERI